MTNILYKGKPLIDVAEPGQVSDGFHTFDELYDHRCVLFAILISNLRVTTTWKSRLHSDGSSWPGWFIAGLEIEPGKQITYHLPEKYWDICNVEQFDRAPEWDGHSSADVLSRIIALAR